MRPPSLDLADFTGSEQSSYSASVSQALVQATLLFGFATGLEQYPDTTAERPLAYNGILEMADKLYLSQLARGAGQSVPVGVHWVVPAFLARRGGLCGKRPGSYGRPGGAETVCNGLVRWRPDQRSV